MLSQLKQKNIYRSENSKNRKRQRDCYYNIRPLWINRASNGIRYCVVIMPCNNALYNVLKVVDLTITYFGISAASA